MPSRLLRHLPCLDGLRAVAVLLVMWAHFPFVAGSAVSEAIWRISQALRTGYIGVDLFFVLSGFLITRILLDERLTNGGISFKTFYVNRALRIFPIYYLCIAVYAAAFAPREGDLSSLVTYTVNFYKPFHPDPAALEHTWSLSVEEQFYLVWPFVVAAIPVRWGKIVTGVVIPVVSFLTALVIAESFDAPAAASVIYMSVFTRMMSLSLGACLAFYEADGDVPDGRRAMITIGAGAGVLVCDNVGRALHVIPPGGLYWSGALVGYALLGFGAIMLLVNAAHPAVAPVRAFLSLAPLRYVGRISYGLYLYHYPILFLFALAPYQVDHLGTDPARLAASLLATFATAHLSYRYIESPLLRLKRRPRLENAGYPIA